MWFRRLHSTTVWIGLPLQVMPKFEVVADVKHPFLSKVKISLKAVALSNSSDAQKRLTSKWDVEKRLFDDIAASSSRSDATKIRELRFILHHISTQVHKGNSYACMKCVTNFDFSIYNIKYNILS